MLELNNWFFMQLANFLLLLIILNIILFKPVLRIFKERDRSTKGFLDDAKRIDKEKDDLIGQIDSRVSEARQKARDIFEGLTGEGLDIQKNTLGSAQNEAAEINRKARDEMYAATESAKKSLKKEIESFSQQIVNKLIKT